MSSQNDRKGIGTTKACLVYSASFLVGVIENWSFPGRHANSIFNNTSILPVIYSLHTYPFKYSIWSIIGWCIIRILFIVAEPNIHITLHFDAFCLSVGGLPWK